MKKFTFLIILMAFTCYGQWTDEYGVNTLVADAPTGDIQSIGTNDGKTYVIFWDESDGYELRVQLLDVDGTQLFGTNGILANDVADNGTWTAIRSQAVDEAGNLYIVFTATNSSSGYLNKISPEGEQIFGASGIEFADGWNMNVLPLSDGGVVVGWEPDSYGHLMKYDATGNPAWDTEIIIDKPDASNPFTGIGDMVALSDGSFVQMITNSATAWTVDAYFWAQRYDGDGNAVWENPVSVSNKLMRSNRRYSISQENDVVYFGYSGVENNRFDAYLQRINADGTLPWGENGIDFGTDDNYFEMDMSIANDPELDYVWAISNITTPAQSQYGVSVQRFNKETGAVELDMFGQTIFPVDPQNWIYVGELQLANDKPLFLFSNNISDGVNPIQLGVVHLDENGEFVWEEEYQMIATSAGNKGRFDFTQNAEGQSVAVWTENRGGTSQAFAQNFVVEPEMNTNDLVSSSVSVYPNPTSGILHIQSDAPIEKIEIYSLTGQLLKKEYSTYELNLSNLNKGVYLMKISPEKGTSLTKKIILK
ncbi:T9SS type A sorting domain-containing protein [Moheibacter lacus]|uniref:T9SS type A sorting domain-containing protein n=1 Tax=Moheibacter lacus TaxID=2745851 RepID=A0A838ZHM9_9FLAO|nr:T9SS type A sorting domain-containing protein [Moheibacter lacus]MBA5629181.1 T9SS type A sorting domain-containing protein [Moheibacter lacus]